MKKSGKILTSADEIKDYMGIGDRIYQHLLKFGLPVVIINGRHYAHADNLDDWWKTRSTKQQTLEVGEL